MNGYQGTADDNKALAASIRGFVEAMPPIETERHQIKRDLVQKFTIPPAKIHSGIEPAPPPSAEPKKGADQAAPKGGRKDLER